jgi:hypothetical protein
MISYEHIPDHPEIRWAERTGYPSWNQEIIPVCENCGEEIDGDEYADWRYDTLCERCLLILHRK